MRSLSGARVHRLESAPFSSNADPEHRMDELRLKSTISAVKNTQDKFNELAERGKELDSQLSQLPAVPQVSARFLLTLALVAGLVGSVVGICLWLL